ncbi:uncharacterized protein LOC125240616 [Leguminivora glycinivorella]|uniref:uncharacterized protein LOC125240616 n=1 Tax=Leguminivora glycinivorella TaxID=1035111 RepID=UPI00200FF850|nr:uncharacterized protein LOC125240616 [Leguminivora glycinivorella]
MKKPGAGSSKSGLGSIGKSGLSGGKSGLTSGKGSVLGSSSKSGSSTSKTLSSTSKSSISPISKSSGTSISKSASPKTSQSFDFTPSKSKSLIPSSPKSLSPSSSYNVYGTPKSGKSTTFGIIWIPTGKRNKKKDIVLNYNNDDRRRERSPSFYKFMSGDSHETTHKKADDDTGLLVGPDRKLPTAALAATETAVAANITACNLDEKQHLIKPDNDETKEAAGDARDTEDADGDKDYLSNEEPIRHKLPDTSEPDSVYLRAPPPHKARSSASTPDEDSCGIKCLYYTLQCCDCVLM